MRLPAKGSLILVCLLMPPPGSSQGPAQTQSPAFRSDLNVVEIAVVAKDSNDSPITDLKKSDLHLFDDGVEQTILSLEKLSDASVGHPGGPVQTSSEIPNQTTGLTRARPPGRASNPRNKPGQGAGLRTRASAPHWSQRL